MCSCFCKANKSKLLCPMIIHVYISIFLILRYYHNILLIAKFSPCFIEQSWNQTYQLIRAKMRIIKYMHVIFLYCVESIFKKTLHIFFFLWINEFISLPFLQLTYIITFFTMAISQYLLYHCIELMNRNNDSQCWLR